LTRNNECFEDYVVEILDLEITVGYHVLRLVKGSVVSDL